MLKIRLQRVGKINSPSYRIIVAEHTRGPKTGNFVEKLGTYNPKTKFRTLNEERVKYWISVGAQASDTMHNMLIKAGVIQGKKINVLKTMPVAKVEEVVEEKKATEVAAEPVATEEVAVEETPAA